MNFDLVLGTIPSDTEATSSGTELHPVKPIVQMDVDVGSLSNEQLKSMLNKFGISPGPIVGTTRRVYENKLKKLLISSNGSSPLPPSSNQDISVILDDNSIDLTSPQPLESTRDDEVIIVSGFGRSYAGPPTRRTPSPPPTTTFKTAPPPATQYRSSPTNIFSSPTSTTTTTSSSSHFSVVRTPPTEPNVVDDDDDDRMEGEERLRFVSPPTFDDDQEEARAMDFEQETTKIRQRTNIGAGHTPKLYPTLEPTPPSWRRAYGGSDREFSTADDSTNVSSSSTLLRPSVSARKAKPSEVYSNGASKSKFSTGLPIWLKIALCFLITIFVVMLTRRLLDDEDSTSPETMHFDE